MYICKNKNCRIKFIRLMLQLWILNPTDGGLEREKLEEIKEGGLMHHCNLFDTEVTHKIAIAFLPGLASACVDNTTSSLFKSHGSVSVDNLYYKRDGGFTESLVKLLS